MHLQLSRRDFMKSAALFSALGVAPQFLTRTVEGAAQTIEGFKDDRVLVVVQLGGGNDGLNTLVPHGDDVYYQSRPKLGLKKDQLVVIDDHVALNARMTEFMRLYDSGNLAVVQGVGYPNPDRSHFRSMEIWHTASDSEEFLGAGWIGRYFDHNCTGSARPQAGVALGKERPQAFDGARGFGVAFEDPNRFGWEPGIGADTKENFARINRPTGANDGNLDFLRHVTSSAILSSEEVGRAADKAGIAAPQRGRRQPLLELDVIAGLIRGGLQTRIYYVSMSGFDTHANQLDQHNRLLEGVAKSLSEFQATLRRDGTADRVVTMVFSEFGRRVRENGSGGTDHGTAAPMFPLGNGVKPGLHGTFPSLSDLDDGDLKHTVDFREVYAGVLERWLGVNPLPILGRSFVPIHVIA